MRTFSIRFFFSALLITVMLPGCTPKEEPTSLTVANSDTSVYLAFGHQVADYATWRAGFDAAESTRAEFGIEIEYVMQGEDDPNLVWIVASAADQASAEAFMVDPGLARSMEMAGVQGEVYRAILDAGYFSDLDAADYNERVIVQHEVRDFDKWKDVFDGHVGSRERAGVVDLFVTYPIGDTNDVHMMFGISDPTEATAYMSSEALHVAMRLSGVIGEPRAYFVRLAE